MYIECISVDSTYKLVKVMYYVALQADMRLALISVHAEEVV